jgi:hypothetical protein
MNAVTVAEKILASVYIESDEDLPLEHVVNNAFILADLFMAEVDRRK